MTRKTLSAITITDKKNREYDKDARRIYRVDSKVISF